MTSLIEYKVLAGTPHECEDKLNEWKEMYDLTILSMCNYLKRTSTGDLNGTSILLLRTVPQPGKEKAS